MRTTIAAAGVLALTLTACGVRLGPGPTASPAPSASLVSLPATPIQPGGICAGEGHDGPIILKWNGTQVIGIDGSATYEIRWPVRYRAVLDPDFVAVVTDQGDLFLKANEDITGKALALRGYVVCYEGRNGIDVFRALAP